GMAIFMLNPLLLFYIPSINLLCCAPVSASFTSLGFFPTPFLPVLWRCSFFEPAGPVTAQQLRSLFPGLIDNRQPLATTTLNDIYLCSQSPFKPVPPLWPG
ncbi:MAG TPA: hypothetical protein VMW83_15000, partial [Spirochaetia bacterium]|nr:hypothetical protein [Spirochaetia bacterium]